MKKTLLFAVAEATRTPAEALAKEGWRNLCDTTD
jgi:hypothetical protein